MKISGLLLLVFLIAGGCYSAPEAVLLDVRSEAEYRAGHLEHAVNVPHDQVAGKIPVLYPDKDTPLLIYCRSGRRVQIAIETLKKQGYSKLYNLGGMDAASKSTGLPVKNSGENK